MVAFEKGRKILHFLIGQRRRHPVHNGILASAIAECLKLFHQILGMLARQYGVRRISAHAALAMAYLARTSLALADHRVTGGLD